MKHEPRIQNHKLIVAYDGSQFEGWQIQGSKPTVQLAIENALTKCWKQAIRIHGSGRTDAGVHALGQVAHFHAPLKFTPQTCRAALNNNLPAAIRITKVSHVPTSFHSRFSTTGKEYRYQVFDGEILPPLDLGRYWHLPRRLDLAAMQKAATNLLGTHDFASFTSNPGYQRQSTIRTIHHISFTRKGPRVTLVIRGNGFLFRMVRNLMGAFAKVGHGRLDAVAVKKILEAKSRAAAPYTAPAHGLYLSKVFYN